TSTRTRPVGAAARRRRNETRARSARLRAGWLYPAPAAIVNAQRSRPPLGEKNMPSYTRTTGGMKMAHRTLVQIVALISARRLLHERVHAHGHVPGDRRMSR